MINYGNGKIYKIINESGDTIYIGSTTQKLCQRYQLHKYKSKNNKIILIENYACNSKEELLRKEQDCIDEHRHCKLLNKNDAYVSDYKVKKNIYRKKTYEQNRLKIRQRANEKIECKNCGCIIARLNLSRHMKTRKCQTIANEKNNQEIYKEID